MTRIDELWVPQGVKQVLPSEDGRLQARLTGYAHMGGRVHRVKVSALRVLRPYCVWNSMEVSLSGSVYTTWVASREI